MGFESFQVTLRGGQVGHAEVNETVRILPHMKLDPQSAFSPSSICYVMDDGQHVIEVELMDAPVSLSCRFTLCHPDTIDFAFLGLLRRLMVRFGMEATIRDEVRPEHEHSFPLAEFAELSACLPEYIATRRSEWIAEFGTARIAATSAECFRRIILPRCQPHGVLS